jgi:hypothetical protein
MGQMISIKKVDLGLHHGDTGRTKHTLVDSHELGLFPHLRHLLLLGGLSQMTVAFI